MHVRTLTVYRALFRPGIRRFEFEAGHRKPYRSGLTRATIVEYTLYSIPYNIYIYIYIYIYMYNLYSIRCTLYYTTLYYTAHTAPLWPHAC